MMRALRYRGWKWRAIVLLVLVGGAALGVLQLVSPVLQLLAPAVGIEP